MKSAAALLLVTLLGACADTRFHPAPRSPGYPAHRGEVSVLEVFPPEGGYESVGVVIAEGVERVDKQELIEVLKAEARKRGADAIVLQGDIKTRSRGNSTLKLLGAYALKLKP